MMQCLRPAPARCRHDITAHELGGGECGERGCLCSYFVTQDMRLVLDLTAQLADAERTASLRPNPAAWREVDRLQWALRDAKTRLGRRPGQNIGNR